MTVGIVILSGVPIAWALARSLPSTIFLPGSPLFSLLAHRIAPFLASACYIPLLSRVSASLSCGYSARRGASYLDASLHIMTPASLASSSGVCAPPGTPGAWLTSSVPADYPVPRQAPTPRINSRVFGFRLQAPRMPSCGAARRQCRRCLPRGARRSQGVTMPVRSTLRSRIVSRGSLMIL